MAATVPSEATIAEALRETLQAAEVVVLDTSAGCGASFEVGVISPLFEGKPLLARHRMVHEALSTLLPSIHALSIKRTWTPAQQAAEQNKAPKDPS